jgi:hypothetical protein
MTTTHRSPSEKDPKKSSLPPLPYNSEQNWTVPSAVPQEAKIVPIKIRLTPNEAKWPLEFIGPSKSWHLMRMALGGSAMSPGNSYKTYT